MDNEKLALSIASSSLLREGFKRALETAETDVFIPRPSLLSKSERAKRQGLKLFKDLINEQKADLSRRALTIQLLEEKLTFSATQDLAAKSLFLQQALQENGAIYGDTPFNFCISDLPIPKQILTDIEQSAITAFKNIKLCQPINVRKPGAVEEYFDRLGCQPTGARVDIILTEDGPKVIEVNLQWVDAIQALEGFETAYSGSRRKAVDLLANTFQGNRRLAILDLAKGAGSRFKGAKMELETLARNLNERYPFSQVEVFDPRIVNTAYLASFDCFYLNGEPRMIPDISLPEWVEVIATRMRWGKTFPIWRPALDRKKALVEACQRSEVFATTIPYSEDNLRRAKNLFGKIVVKGDGFSSNCVGIEEKDGFEDILVEANQSPDGFIIQPKLKPITLDPLLCFDTSSNIPILLKNPQSKFNVWIINGRLAGMLVSLSDSSMISDKDFNVIPKAI